MRKTIGSAVLVWVAFLALVELDIRWCRHIGRLPQNKPSSSSPGSQASGQNTATEHPGTPGASHRSNRPGERRVGGDVPGHSPPHLYDGQSVPDA